MKGLRLITQILLLVSLMTRYFQAAVFDQPVGPTDFYCVLLLIGLAVLVRGD